MRRIDKEELKKIQIEILKYIDSICRENNIEYFLIAGSLIGAVRHDGFIPWDDDIDIALTQDNYKKLIDILEKQNNNPYLLLNYEKQKNSLYPFAKLVNTNTVMVEHNIKPINNYGVYVDIFFYTGLPNDAKKRIKFCKKIKRNVRLIFYHNFQKIEEKNIIKKIMKQIIKLYTSIIGLDRIMGKNKKLNNTYKIEESKYAIINWPTYKIEKEIQESKNLIGTVDHKFENLLIKIPQNYDNILKTTFGDYMTPPPPQERVGKHNIEAYWKN